METPTQQAIDERKTTITQCYPTTQLEIARSAELHKLGLLDQ